MSSRPKRRPQTAQPKLARESGSRFVPWLLAAAAALVIAGAVFVVWPALNRTAVASGSEPGLVTMVESLYNDIYLYRQSDGKFMLSFGAKRLRYTELIVNPNDDLELPVYYTRSMVAGALAYPSNAEGCRDHRPRRRENRLVPSQVRTRAELHGRRA